MIYRLWHASARRGAGGVRCGTGRCYRMLGSIVNTEEAMQKATLRAWDGHGQFQEPSSLKMWLYRIATPAYA